MYLELLLPNFNGLIKLSLCLLMNRFSLRIISASYIKNLFVFLIVHCTYLPAHMKTACFLHLEQHCKDGAIKKHLRFNTSKELLQQNRCPVNQLKDTKRLFTYETLIILKDRPSINPFYKTITTVLKSSVLRNFHSEGKGCTDTYERRNYGTVRQTQKFTKKKTIR